jgi:hypothetical protein
VPSTVRIITPEFGSTGIEWNAVNRDAEVVRMLGNAASERHRVLRHLIVIALL